MWVGLIRDSLGRIEGSSRLRRIPGAMHMYAEWKPALSGALRGARPLTRDGSAGEFLMKLSTCK